MFNVYKVTALDKHNAERSFFQAADSADEASHLIDKVLHENELFKCASPWMHVETTLVVGGA